MKYVVTGDTHGDMHRFKNYPYERDGNTAVIILGDSGVNYFLSLRDRRVKHELQKSGYLYYLVRGNHEARPEEVADIELTNDLLVGNEVYVEPEFPAIRYLKDGGIYNFNGHKTLVIGGAYSVDKWYRLSRNLIWHKNEQLTGEEKEKIYEEVKGQDFDFVFTHTCPYSWIPTDLFIPGINQDTVDNSTELWLEDIKEAINYKVWLFGHYHADRIERPGVEQYFKSDDDLEMIFDRWNHLEPMSCFYPVDCLI